MSNNRTPPLLGFIDLLLNLAIMFCFLFMLSQILISVTKAKESSASREGKYVIVVEWNEGIDADVDTWVMAPNNERSGFFSRDQGTMSLLRDDLGSRNDYVIDKDGKQVLNPINREEVTLRSTMTGKYIVNIHYFRAPSDQPPEVTIKVTLKTIKDDIILVEREIKMDTRGQEMTPFTFTLDQAGILVETSKPDKPIPWVVNGANTNNNIVIP